MDAKDSKEERQVEEEEDNLLIDEEEENGSHAQASSNLQDTSIKPTNSKKNKSAGSQRIKRPMNAFMVWSSLERKRLAEKEPNLHNTELSKRLGEMWKAMTEEKKQPFRDEAQKLKEKLMKEHPDYKYRPRRRKELKHIQNPGSLFAPPTHPIESYPSQSGLLQGASLYPYHAVSNETSYPSYNNEKNYMAYPYSYVNSTQVQLRHLPAYASSYVVSHPAPMNGAIPLSHHISYASLPLQYHPVQSSPYGSQTNTSSSNMYKVEPQSDTKYSHMLLSGVDQQQPSPDATLEYNVNSVTTSPNQVHTGSYDSSSSAFIHTSSYDALPRSSQQHHSEVYPSVMETPPCSPYMASTHVQSYNSSVSLTPTTTQVQNTIQSILIIYLCTNCNS